MPEQETSPPKSMSSYETDLISIIAHELRSPVGATRGFVELVQRGDNLTQSQQYYLSKAIVALNRMENLIIGLLDYAHIENGMALNLGTVQMPALIDGALEYLLDVAEQRGITLKVELPSNLPPIVADAQLLGHVVSNLVSNAIKYNKDDGAIVIIASNHHRVMRVDVRDTGLGIPSESLPFVFDRFYRAHSETDKKGTGLGLSICKSIIELHGGNIWVESKVNVGSTFSFTLPMEARPAATDRKRQTSVFESAGEEDDPIDDDAQDSSEDADTDPRNDAPR